MDSEKRYNGVSEATIQEAWKLRRMGIYTVREIATKLKVERATLIDAMEAWAKNQEAEHELSS